MEPRALRRYSNDEQAKELASITIRLSKKGKKALKNVKKAEVSVELQVVDGV